MRPLVLELAHFRSYDRETVDWTAFDLVVIAGDTGAGKTSLLDAIAFALYGRTPETTRSGELLTVGRDNGEVRLTFALRDETWRVTRRFGPKAPDPARLLERLEGGPDGVAAEIVDEGVDERLRTLLGLGFEAFTSAVLLAQGRFARFLGAPPKDRDAILRELFAVVPLEGARQAAVRAQAARTGEADGMERAVDALTGHGPGAWWAAARHARRAATTRCRVRALEPLAGVATREGGRAAAAAARARAAREAAAALPDAEMCAALTERLRRASAAVAAAETGRARAGRDHEAAVAAREMLRVRHGGDGAALGTLLGVAERLAGLSRTVPEHEAALRDARARVAERRAALRAAADEGARAAEAHAALVARRDALADAVRARRAAGDAAGAVAAAETALADAARVHDAAQRARDAARRAHEDAVRDDHAAAIRAGLRPGDDCPVCGAPVSGDAPTPAASDIAALRRAVEEATRDERTAGQARAAASAARDAAVRARDTARAAVAAADTALAATGDPPDDPAGALVGAEAEVAASDALLERARGAYDAERGAVEAEDAALHRDEARLARDRAERDAARERLGTWAAAADPAEALRAALEEVRDAEAAERAAAEAVNTAAQGERRARAALRELESVELDRLRGAAARTAAAAGLAPPDDGLAAEGLIGACAALREAAADLAARAAAEEAHASAARDAAEAALVEAGAAVGVTGTADLAGALRRAEADAADARRALAAVVAAAAQARSLRQDAAAARAEAALHAQVARDLRADNFPRFLLGRFRERLAAGASVRLQELSHGAFRFAGTGADPLLVVDVRRGEATRPASTLSGGERFLASLSLALGLADIAAESGGRLDCLFLDEGFSTLDADSLEQALSGVERLAGEGRLIAVITHLPGVAERLGAALRVAKDPQGVSRVVEAG